MLSNDFSSLRKGLVMISYYQENRDVNGTKLGVALSSSGTTVLNNLPWFSIAHIAFEFVRHEGSDLVVQRSHSGPD